MKRINNELGNTLLIVMIIVIVFTIIGVGLLSINISASKQFNHKEEQVQARHLAEMGIIHHKANIEEAVDLYHSKPFEFVYIKKKGNGNNDDDKIIDEEASKRKYFNELCNAVKNVSVSTYTTQLGTYIVNGSLNCSMDSEGNIPTKMIVNLESDGKSKDVTKKILAKVTISSGGELGSGTDDSSIGEVKNPGEIPKKPDYPVSNWGTIPTVNNLDAIQNPKPAKVIHAITSKNPFETTSFVEILGSADMEKKSNWTFNDHLIIGGSFKTNTGGKDASLLTVNKDLYVGGAFDHLSNHTKSIIRGNFIVKGDMRFGTKSQFMVGGNALFDYGISLVDTHAQVTINQNAYFKKPLGSVKTKANVCVKGDIFLWKNNQWAPYLPADSGYGGFDAKCIGTAPDNSGEIYKWTVEPNLQAEYK